MNFDFSLVLKSNIEIHIVFFSQVRRRREELLRAREELEAERARWSSKLSYLEETVLTGIGKELGMFTLEVTGAGVTVTARTLVGGAGRYSGQERGGRSS